MSMNTTPSGERIHIGIFGKRNAGKSSLINAVTGQSLAIVSDIKGTTTDPVKKAMELLPLGPVVLIDTPGLDDQGALGQERIKKARQALHQSDIALVVADGQELMTCMPEDGEEASWQEHLRLEKDLFGEISERKIPGLFVVNKADLWSVQDEAGEKIRKKLSSFLGITEKQILFCSAAKGFGISELKETMGHLLDEGKKEPVLIRDLLKTGDLVVLVVPIDSAAPKGRLILPQQQVIRDALEAGAIPVVTRETELVQTLGSLSKPPRLVVTDSQAFERVAKETPREIPLTSFSILMARYKGDLAVQAAGARAIEDLQDGDKVLIAEGCTHHRQCEDIGTVKMPRWIRQYTGKDLQFVFTSGTEFPEDLSEYALVVHCGGCMLNPREMEHRIARGAAENVPITNYGVMIAYIHGILDRALEPFE